MFDDLGLMSGHLKWGKKWRPAQNLNDARTRIVGIDVSARKETTEKPCYFVTSGALRHGPRDLAPAP